MISCFHTLATGCGGILPAEVFEMMQLSKYLYNFTLRMFKNMFTFIQQKKKIILPYSLLGGFGSMHTSQKIIMLQFNAF